MDRFKIIIDRIESELKNEGLTKKIIFEASESGYADFASFFELMVDLRLDGKDQLKAEEVWENMKKQTNYWRMTILKAAEDSRKMENRIRDLQNNYDELIKEQKTKE
jgi:hypothetical protein